MSLDVEGTAQAVKAALGASKARVRALESLHKALIGFEPGAVSRAMQKLEALGDQGSGDLQAQVRGLLAEEARTRGPRLAAALRARCEAEGIALAVVTRQPLELRLPPVGVTVDLAKDRADLTFGRNRLARVSAQADAIIQARHEALTELEAGPWDPEAYLFSLYKAWRRTTPKGDWIELVDVLPELVLELQSDAWRREPSARNFRPYSRARYCYDLHRLRRDRALLLKQTWRLNLGAATGGSTKDKKRVLWLEDAQGRGQYHLTLRFTRESE